MTRNELIEKMTNLLESEHYNHLNAFMFLNEETEEYYEKSEYDPEVIVINHHFDEIRVECEFNWYSRFVTIQFNKTNSFEIVAKEDIFYHGFEDVYNIFEIYLNQVFCLCNTNQYMIDRLISEIRLASTKLDLLKSKINQFS